MEYKGYLFNLGLIEYKKAWDLQLDLWAKRVEGRVPDLLLFLEHPHVLTLGRRGNRTHLLASSEILTKRNIPVFHIERGGDVTYHGPGQLVVYPILDLKEYGWNLVRYIEQLEEVIIRTLSDFGISAKRDSLNRGVWVDRQKIASVGVAVKRWVSFHGFALNYETDLTYFDLINPCGLEGIRMTSMSKTLGANVSRDRLYQRVHFHFEQVFERRWEEKRLEEIVPSLDSGHMQTAGESTHSLVASIK